MDVFAQNRKYTKSNYYSATKGKKVFQVKYGEVKADKFIIAVLPSIWMAQTNVPNKIIMVIL